MCSESSEGKGPGHDYYNTHMMTVGYLSPLLTEQKASLSHLVLTVLMNSKTYV